MPDFSDPNYDFDEAQAALARKRKDIAALLSGPAVDSGYRGKYWINPYPAQLAKSLQDTAGLYAQSEIDKQSADLATGRNAEMAKWYQDLPMPKPGVPALPATEGLGPTGEVPAQGSREAGAPAVPPMVPTPLDYMKWSERGLRLGAPAQKIAEHVSDRAIDTTMPTKPVAQNWERGADTVGPDGKPMETFWLKSDPNVRKVGDVVYKQDEFQQKIVEQKKLLAMDPATKDLTEEQRTVIATKAALGNITATPPNAEGKVGLVDKTVLAAGQLPPPRQVVPAPTPVPIPPPQPQIAPFTPPAAAAPPPLVPTPPQDLRMAEDQPPPLIPQSPTAAATPPMVPDISVPETVRGVDVRTNFSGTPEEQAKARAAMSADVLKGKSVFQLSETEKRERYGKDSRNAPFLTGEPQPGVTLVGGVPGASGSAALNGALEKVAAERDKIFVPTLEKHMQDFDATVTQLAQAHPEAGVVRDPKTGEWTGKAPGAGIGQLNPFPGVPAQDLQRVKVALDNTITLMVSGKAVTESEGARLSKQLGNAITQGPKAFWDAVANIRSDIKAADANILRRFPPIVQDAWRDSSVQDLRGKYGL